MSEKRSILGLIPLINLLEAHGHDPLPLLQKHHIALDSMMGNALIEPSVELEIVEDIMARLKMPLLGLEVGRHINFTSYSTLAMLIMTSPSLLQACRVSVQFQALSLLFSRATLYMEKNWIEIRFALPACNTELRDFIADRDLMGTLMFINEIIPAQARSLLSCGIARTKPIGNDLKTYLKYVNVNVQFDQSYSWFRIPSEFIRLAPPHANPLVHKIHLIQAYELMSSFWPESDNAVEQVKRLLSGYETHFPSLPEIAKAIGKSERTLRRNLNDAGLTYRALLDDFKKKRALDMLALRDMNVSTLTQALGYTEAASFLRAFKRWTGLTPKQYLKSIDLQQTL